jgi:hypothetical protein
MGENMKTKKTMKRNTGNRRLYGAVTVIMLASLVPAMALPFGAPSVIVQADINGPNDIMVNTDDIMSDEVSQAMRKALSGETYTGVIKNIGWHSGEMVDGIQLTTVAENASTMGALFPGNGNVAASDNIVSTDAAYNFANGASVSLLISDVGIYEGNDGTTQSVNLRVFPETFTSASNLPYDVVYAVKNHGGTITIAAMSRYSGALTGSGGEGGSSSGGGSGATGYGRLGMSGFSYYVMFEFEDGTAVPETTAFGAKFSEIDAAQSVDIDQYGLEGVIRRNDSALTKVQNGLANTDPTATTADSSSLSRTAFLAIYKQNRMRVAYTSNLSTAPLDIVTSLFGHAPEIPNVPKPESPSAPIAPTPPSFDGLSVESEPVAPTPPPLPELEVYQDYPKLESLKQVTQPRKDVLDGQSKASINGKSTLTDIEWLWKVTQKLDAPDDAYSVYQDYVDSVKAVSVENRAVKSRNEAKKTAYESDYVAYEAAYERYVSDITAYNDRISKNVIAWQAYESDWEEYLSRYATYSEQYATYEQAYQQYQAAWQNFISNGGAGTKDDLVVKVGVATKTATPESRYFTTVTAKTKVESQEELLVIHPLPAEPSTSEEDFLFNHFVVVDRFDLDKVVLSDSNDIYVLDEEGKVIDPELYTIERLTEKETTQVTVSFTEDYLKSDAFYARGNDKDGYQIYIPSLTNIDDQAEGVDTKMTTNKAEVSLEPGEDAPTNEVSVSPVYTEAAIQKTVLQYRDEPSFDELLRHSGWKKREYLETTESRYAYKLQYDLGNHADYASITLSDPWFADIQLAPDDLAVYATVTSAYGQERVQKRLEVGKDYQVTYGDANELQTDGKMADCMGFEIVLTDVGQYARKTVRFEVVLMGVTLQGMSGQESYHYLNNDDVSGPNGAQHQTLTDNAIHVYNTGRLDFVDKTPDDVSDSENGTLISNTTEVVPPVLGPQTQKFVELDELFEPALKGGQE